MKVILIASGIFTLTVLLGCREATPESPLPLVERIQLTPYLTITPGEKTSLEENSQITPTSTAIPSPTPTPFLYTIIKDDTLTGIAFKHGIKLQDLIAANPGIDPNFLTVGTSLTIPITGSLLTTSLEPTPVPIRFFQPKCYPDSSGGLWCLSVVVNEQPFDVENISAQMIIASPKEPELTSTEAIAPVNVLPSGDSAILTAYFPAPIPQDWSPQIDLNSVLPLEKGSPRYLDLTIQNESIDISEDRAQAIIRGSLSVANPDQTANQIWIAAFAYAQDGAPVGMRKWISEDPLTAAEILQFEFRLYSLGPPITEIKVLYEAKP